jgi:hypothetical protein
MRLSFYHYCIAAFAFIFTSACNNAEESKDNKKAELSKTAETPEVVKPQALYLATFEVKNDKGEIQGWGYDIYADSVKTIHQTVIPAVSGIRSFKTKEDAEKTGNYAISKMKISGSFPTLSIQELDSLGVTK